MRLAIFVFGIFAMTAHADEGMWLPNEPPRERLQAHGFTATDDWLNQVRLASVRFNNGGSGGFVSENGLIITNHHIAADALHKLSTPDRDLLKNGFHAPKLSDELRCHDLELNVLQSIEDVTAKVEAAVKPDMSPSDAFSARRAVMAAIEKESLEATGQRSDIVTLYHGGAYHLYRYKKYTDVRLVLAPEAAIANFGGDVDNFEFPRYCLDFCFLRAYENGVPAKVKNYFPWSATPPAEGDLVFVVGHPGTTNRLETYAKLVHRRDKSMPYTLARVRSLEAALVQYSDRGPEERQAAVHDLQRVANARKALNGQYQGLLNPALMAEKKTEEAKLREKANHDAWKDVEDAQSRFEGFEREYALLEQGNAFPSELFSIARYLVRMSAETPKPNAMRLREYRDSNLESMKYQLFSPAPINPDLERLKLTCGLTFLAENLGGGHPLVLKLLAGKSPSARATELIAGTNLFDPMVRKKIHEAGAAGIGTSTDTIIQFAQLMDAESRALRQRYETEVEEPERQANAKIAKTRFAAFGKSIAPDATFTLRVAFGIVRGYEVDGQNVPFFTTFEGLFARSDKQGNVFPFELPARWRDNRAKLDMNAPMDFCSTADTIGGNSGSPVLNRNGELVGLNFDRNRHGLVRNFIYTDVQARHIAVHGFGILEALRKIYGAEELVNELMRKN